jgi:hypothetical protein
MLQRHHECAHFQQENMGALHFQQQKRNGWSWSWSDKFDCITWEARDLRALAKKARRGQYEDSLWRVLEKMANKFRTISNRTKKDMPDAVAGARKTPAIPKSASLRTLWADDTSTKAKALLKATHDARTQTVQMEIMEGGHGHEHGSQKMQSIRKGPMG